MSDSPLIIEALRHERAADYLRMRLEDEPDNHHVRARLQQRERRAAILRAADAVVEKLLVMQKTYRRGFTTRALYTDVDAVFDALDTFEAACRQEKEHE